MKLKVGDEATWTTGANGVEKEKSGRVVALLPAGDNFYQRVKADAGLASEVRRASKSAIKVDLNVSTVDRYVVSVPRVRKDGKPLTSVDIYAPRASVVDKQMEAAAAAAGTAQR